MEQHDGKTPEPSPFTIWSINFKKNTMKKLFALLVFCSGFVIAQMPNISKVWTNNNLPYNGGFGEKSPLKIMLLTSEQNKKNDQEYFVSGQSTKENTDAKLEGSMTVKKYKDFKKRGKLFGNYEFAEENTGNNSGIYKGKFIFSFDWDKDTKQVTNKKIEFKGKWYPYQKSKEENTFWVN